MAVAMPQREEQPSKPSGLIAQGWKGTADTGSDLELDEPEWPSVAFIWNPHWCIRWRWKLAKDLVSLQLRQRKAKSSYLWPPYLTCLALSRSKAYARGHLT